MDFKKMKLAAGPRRTLSSKSPRITVRGYIGTFNVQGRDLLGEVCKAWQLPLKVPAALALHTPDGIAPEFTLCAAPVTVVTADDLKIKANATADRITIDLYPYMHSINLHLGTRTKWTIYLEIGTGVQGKPCLFLDTQTDMEEIRKKQEAAKSDAAKSDSANSGPKVSA